MGRMLSTRYSWVSSIAERRRVKRVNPVCQNKDLSHVLLVGVTVSGFGMEVL
jgi:hypothetical protein